MAEYIDREAVCKALNSEGYTKNMRVHKAILAIPVTDVKPVNPAEWIEDGYRGLPCVCSYCGEPGKRDWRFCPYCGATMKVAQDPAPDPKSTFYDLLYEEGGANTT